MHYFRFSFWVYQGEGCIEEFAHCVMFCYEPFLKGTCKSKSNFKHIGEMLLHEHRDGCCLMLESLVYCLESLVI